MQIRYERPQLLELRRLERLIINGKEGPEPAASWSGQQAGAGQPQRMLIVSAGQVSVQSDAYNGVCAEGDMLVFHGAPSVFQIKILCPPAVLFWLEFDAARAVLEAGGWRLDELRPFPVGKAAIEAFSLVRHRLETLHQQWNDSREDACAAHICWLELWDSLIKGTFNVSDRSLELNQLLRDMLEQMDRHPERAYPIEELAKYSGVAPAKFYRTFKEHSSMSPLQYVTKKRMERATTKLMNPELTIEAVSSAVGYPDMHYFNRMFKKVIGVPPSRYRKAMNRTIAVLHPVFYNNLLALGVPRTRLLPLWQPQLVKHAHRYEQMEEPEIDVKWLAKAKPDLIIGSNRSRLPEADLQAIAPSIFIPYKPNTWREHLLEIGLALEIEEVARQWLHYYDLKAAVVRGRLHRRLKEQSVLAAVVHRSGVRVVGMQRRKLGQLLYGDLQLNAPEGLRAVAVADLQRIEEINDFKAEHVLLFHEASLGQAERVSGSIRGIVHLADVCPWLQYCALGHSRSIDDALLHFSG